MRYKLIGFDMDGTLLDSEKKVTPRTADAVRKAVKEGACVVYLSGRSLPELWPYVKILPEIRYGVCLNGSILYDFQADEMLARSVFSADEIDLLIQVTEQEDMMLELVEGGAGHTAKRDIEENLEHYRVADNRDLLLATSVMVDDIRAMLLDRTRVFEKVDLYHADPSARERTFSRLSAGTLEKARYHEAKIETTPHGVSKATGLARLCEHLGIALSETIVVGDSFNDESAMRIAGLSVAMGNADEGIKEICDAVVADNDHDGCAEVIERFILHGEK